GGAVAAEDIAARVDLAREVAVCVVGVAGRLALRPRDAGELVVLVVAVGGREVGRVAAATIAARADHRQLIPGAVVGVRGNRRLQRSYAVWVRAGRLGHVVGVVVGRGCGVTICICDA